MTLKTAACCMFLLAPAALGAQAAEDSLIDHRIDVELFPETQRLQVRDLIRLPASAPREFALHRGLDPHIITPGAKLAKTGLLRRHPIHQYYRVELAPGVREFELEYGGEIAHDFQTRRESPGRDRQLLAGTIASDGVFLDSGVAWYPVFGDAHQRFTLQIRVPAGWHAVSQGEGPVETTDERGRRRIQWRERHPQDDIYLIAAPFQLYRDGEGAVEAQVFLRQPDPALAQRYLGVTEHYLALYQALIGPYPYAKFALVENFWETGYGMPSFTLLGPRVIRLPFILHTSYPHEILHNWWGNGVYVDYQRGNWSEGLTAYLADHLLKEQRGQGIEYRRSALQRYADFIRSENDFPLVEFRARHTTASQAVGYDKGLMLFHMLRRRLGDTLFIDGLRRFYRDNRFQTAAFDDLQRAFETAGGESLADFFEQWTRRTGAPALAVDAVRVSETDSGFRLQGVVRQTQAEQPFALQVPMLIYVASAAEPIRHRLAVQQRSTAFSIELPARPLLLDVDPWFDLFRGLAVDEAPPTLSKLLGAERALFVLPARAPSDLLAAYRRLAQQWAEGYAEATIVRDEELRALPPQTPTWLLGWENRFADPLLARFDETRFERDAETFEVSGKDFSADGHSLVMVDQGGASDRITALIASDDPRALPGLSRKVPHYGKYSYLVFAGETPDNRLKGQWPVIDSPLLIALSEQAAAIEPLLPKPLWPRPDGADEASARAAAAGQR